MAPKPRERGVRPQPNSQPSTGRAWLFMVLGVGLFALGVYWLLGNYSSHSTKAYFGIAFILIGFIVGLVGAVQASNARARRR